MASIQQAQALPWTRPLVVADVRETGEHVDITADDDTRAAIAKLAGVRSLPRLSASFDVMRTGGEGLRVTGKVSATVGQTCIVTLEPIENKVEEAIELIFAQAVDLAALGGGKEDEDTPASAAMSDRLPEPIIGGTVDLGAIATEFLLLGIDPYPRKPDAVFEGPAAKDDPATHPFAALAALKKLSQPDEK